MNFCARVHSSKLQTHTYEQPNVHININPCDILSLETLALLDFHVETNFHLQGFLSKQIYASSGCVWVQSTNYLSGETFSLAST